MTDTARVAYKCRVPPAVVAAWTIAGVSIAWLAPAAMAAPQLPVGFEHKTSVDAGLDKPTAMAFAPDGRLFVCEQGGRLRVVRDGRLLDAPFLTVAVDATGERGLLGVAVDPAFDINRHVYVYYTAAGPAVQDRVSRFTADGDVARPESETVLLEIPDPPRGVMHNGGALRFAKDGTLIIAIGDHGQPERAPALDTLHGKLLRMNRDGTVPADNPYVAKAEGRHRLIWARGLRNPAALDVEARTGRLFVNDVGAQSWEEINEGAAGADYGWPGSEGPAPRPVNGPLHAYAWHEDQTAACSIVGAAFYDPPVRNFPAEYVGRYFFADLCANWIDMLDLPKGGARSRFVAETAPTPVDLEVAPDGTLYYLTYKGGLHQIRFAGDRAAR